MPVSLSITAFLSHYTNLSAKVQPQFVVWAEEQKERARASLLLAQLEDDVEAGRAKETLTAQKALSAADDAHDAKDEHQIKEREEQAAVSAVEAAVQARDAEEESAAKCAASAYSVVQLAYVSDKVAQGARSAGYQAQGRGLGGSDRGTSLHRRR
jgi:hypothetical protein